MTFHESPSEARRAESGRPVLETDRLVLRAPRIDDLPAIATLARDSGSAEMTANLPFPYRAADVSALFEDMPAAARSAVFAMLLKREDRLDLVGFIGFGRRPTDTVPEIGYWIGAPFLGIGIATEAVRAVIDYVFSQTGIARLGATARVTNPAARRVLERCGFEWCGVGLIQMRARGGSVPMDRFEIDRAGWTSLRAWGTTALPHLRAAAR